MTAQTPIAAAPSRAKVWPSIVLVAALLGGFWVLMVASISGKSLTYDEGIHLAGGYTYWKFNDYRINAENGNLPQRVTALPLVLGDYKFPSIQQKTWYESNGWKLGDEFLHDMGNDLGRMLLAGRASIAGLAVILGLVVYLWSRRLFGPLGGLVSLLLFILSPTVLANGPLMVSDVAGALFFLLSSWCLWTVLHKVTPWTLLASGLAMGGLFVAKMSAPLIVIIGMILVVIRLIHREDLKVAIGRRVWQVRERGRQAMMFAGAMAMHVVLVLLVIWTFYGFRYDMMADAQSGRDKTFSPNLLDKNSEMSLSVRLARNSHLLPEAYLYGEAFVLKSAQQRFAFLNGQCGLKGWASFFPYTFLVKTPLSVFAVVILAVLAAFAKWRSADLKPPAWQRDDGEAGSPVQSSISGSEIASREEEDSNGHTVSPFRQALYRTAPLWTLMAVYWLTVVMSHLNIGHRHILPVYPPMFILAGASAYWLNRLRKPMAVVLIAAMALLAFETLYRYPNYLAYFNQTIGGPRNAYKHLVDSSLDWGQDLPALKKYLVDQGMETGSTRVYLSYFGMDRPESYKICAMRVDDPPMTDPPATPKVLTFKGGVYCISATNLQPAQLSPEGPWNQKYERMYRGARSDLPRLEKTANDPAARVQLIKGNERYWKRLETIVNQMTFARLRAYLRQREPDDMVNYSILIYRLTDDQVRQALEGPMPEDGECLLDKIKQD